MSLPAFLARSAAAAAAVVTVTSAIAQDMPVIEDPAAENWKFSVGLGVMSRAKYPGSSEREVSALPIVSANYGRFFIGGLPDAGLPVGLGATLLQAGPWRAGIGLGVGLQKARKESDSSRLRGLGDIDSTTSGSAFASYDAGFVVARSSVVTDIAGHHQGTRINFDLEARYSPMARWMFSGGPGLTWADRNYTQTFFGITAAQSAASGLAQHDTSAGLHALRFGLGANYQMTQKWGLGARATVSNLRGDAADSPITEKKTQTSFGLFTTYRF